MGRGKEQVGQNDYMHLCLYIKGRGRDKGLLFEIYLALPVVLPCWSGISPS